MPKKLTKEDFIKRAIKIHNNYYDYSKVDYINSQTKVCIICPTHGEFWQIPTSHLNGNGCNLCGQIKCRKSRKHSTDWFITEARKIHGDKYDYSKVEYTHLFTKVCIICPTHGEFWQTPTNHIYSKNGCNKCGGTYKLNTEEFIKKSQQIHGGKYDYSKVEYKGNKVKVCIICSEHGEFWQTPNGHLNGDGCPKCKSSHMEREMRLFLEQNNVSYEEQKTFEWLKFKRQQYLDFYLPEYNVGIECQGEQHFQKSGWGKGDNGEKVLKRDLNKSKLCEKHNVKLYYYSKLNIDYPYNVFENKENLLDFIKRREKNI